MREALEAFSAAFAASTARELAGGGDAGYYLVQVALQDAVARSQLALERREQVSISMQIRNRNRCVGGILSSHIAQRCGAGRLEEDSIVVEFEGSAGQSSARWLAPGIELTLLGTPTTTPARGSRAGIAVAPARGRQPSPPRRT